MKSLNVELFNQNRPEYGQDVTLSITHNGYAPEKAGEVEIYLECERRCEYTAHMIISGGEGQDSAACYAITSDTALNSDTYEDLILSLKSRIVDLFGGPDQ